MEIFYRNITALKKEKEKFSIHIANGNILSEGRNNR